MKVYDMVYFIEFVADLVSEFDIFYEQAVDSKYYFNHGGCYELYKVAKHYFPTVECAMKKDYTHCAILYNNEIFDISGKIENIEEYRLATKDDIDYMEDRFGLHIKEIESENIITELDKCRIKGKLYE